MEGFTFAPLKKSTRQYGTGFAQQIQASNCGTRNVRKSMTICHNHVKGK